MPISQAILRTTLRQRSKWSVAVCLVGIATFVGSAINAQTRAAETIDFNRDIRPILSDNCFQCHGPDAESREAELRLDRRAEATAERDGIRPIHPGSPDKSSLIARVRSVDPDTRMPPLSSKKQLNDKQIQMLNRWISEGANYDLHWAFRAIQNPAHPSVRQTNWVRNPIDRFVLARLEKEGLTPSRMAGHRTLIKRVYLDLIGLLPNDKETAKYAALLEADEERGLSQLIDDLLNSPHYGERWGRHWLDQARYADSNGYTIDGDRVMWPYRDWVIRAIQDDMPFDQFTIEQLAGDLLPNPSKRQLLATGFHRNTLINQEGGTDPEQFRNEAVVDRVNTTAAVWLGLTVGCAQCHNHKFDPISQREYYEFFAFFNHCQDKNNVGPTVEVAENELFAEPSAKLLDDIDKARKSVVRLEKEMAKRQSEWEAQLAKELEARPAPQWSKLDCSELQASGDSRLSLLEDGSVLAARGAAKETYSVQVTGGVSKVAAIRMRVIPHNSLPKGGPGLAGNGNFVLTRFEIWRGDKQLSIARAVADHAQPKFPIVNVIDDDPATGWAINVGKGTRAGVKMNAEHYATFVLNIPHDDIATHPLRVVLRHELNGSHYNIGRFALDASPIAPTAKFDAELTAALQVEPAKRNTMQKARLADEFASYDQPLIEAKRSVAAMRNQLGFGGSAKSMIVRELPTPRETYIHVRGDFLRLDKETGPLFSATPAILPPLPESSNQVGNRLDLAKWLVDPSNPLTARVTVNRVWMRFFGRGIVVTENDFGSQGSPPTHPLLLDWLSRQFIEQGWSMKRLHKLILMSATYRQASDYRADLTAVDGVNQLLGRQNRLRVDAEIIRDAALSASGLLSRKVGGPSVRPPQPAGVYAFTQIPKNWAVDKGPNRFRRAMYTRFYRSAPYPMLTTFDAPDFQSVCTRRSRSNTPLQSLTMANDMTFIEFAKGLSARLLRSVPDATESSDQKRIRLAFELCFCRPPSRGESQLLQSFLDSQIEQFENDAKSAAAVAPLELPPGISVSVGAAWTALARGLMNTDEFITRE